MTRPDGAPAVRTSAAEVAQAVLALLPALVLAWPFGAPLEHDFSPRSTGAGLAALLALPGVALFVLRGAAPRARGSFLLVAILLATAAWLAFGATADPFEATRATIGWTLVLASFFVGAASDPQTLARGAALVGFCAALSGWEAPHAGALGNSGGTSELATLGAAAGAYLVVRERGLWRIVGVQAFALFLLHVARAPVLAGGVAVCASLVVAAFASHGVRRFAIGFLAVIATVALVVPFAIRGATDDAPAATAVRVDESRVDTSPASGAGVRARILASSARMLAAHPLAGVGPGQFPAQFPPFRDAAEIEASSHGRLQAAETEVEHAHDDWIQPALELGIVAGVAWIAFLALTLAAAWRALRSDDAHRAALGVGVAALLVHALARAPITANAASATLFAAAAGALLARRDGIAPTWKSRAVPLASMALVAMLAPRAWSAVKHGYALRDLVLDAHDADPARRERAIENALAAEPDSVLARTLEARLAEAHGEPPYRVAAHWSGVLALRPHRVEALVQSATALARADRMDEARAALVHALSIDPGNPPALQNLATMELSAGELESGLARLDRIPAARAPDAEWLRGLAARLALRGLDPESAALTARTDPARTELAPEERFALARELRAAGKQEQADGWEARAHRAWADEHAAGRRWSDAVRSARQDLRLCLERPNADPVRVRLVLAAALQSAGRGDEAREQLALNAAKPSARDLDVLPAWTREPLAALGAR